MHTTVPQHFCLNFIYFKFNRVVAFVTALLHISIDLYLPGLPGMAAEFGASKGVVNLTLILFFLGMAGSMIIWGPLSDKYGRKPELLAGLVLFSASSLACAVAAGIGQLILFRVLQSFVAGAGVAVNNAILKDVFSGRERERALATVITLILIAPVACGGPQAFCGLGSGALG